MRVKNIHVRLFFVICLLAVIAIGVILSHMTKQPSFEVVNADKNYLNADDSEVGRNAKISSVQITQTDTGTGPFDADDSAGNDSSKTNDVVRTFDQITWTVEGTMVLKPGATVGSCKGGTFNVVATLSDNVEDTVTWDLQSMLWIENATMSNNGRTVTGQYKMAENQVTVPGKQTLVFVAKVMDAKNNTQITANFNLNLIGNDANDSKTISVPAIRVSAAPNYNIKIAKSGHIDTLGHFDTSTGEKVESANANTLYGRMQGYGVVVQLYNTSTSKGLKGIEIPTGNISFDLNLDERTTTNASSSLIADPEYVPYLWDYKPNVHDNRGMNNRNMMFDGVNNSKYALGCAPMNNVTLASKYNSVFDGGNYSITKTDDTKYRVTISNYRFDINNMQFPTHTYGQNSVDGRAYTDNVGCFSAGYIEVLCRFPTSVSNLSNIYLSANVDNFSSLSVTNQQGIDKVTTDNSLVSSITLYPPGTITRVYYIRDETNTKLLQNIYYEGKSKAFLGQKITAHMELKRLSDHPVKAYNYLFKFDTNAFEFNGTRLSTTKQNASSVLGTTTYLYAAKQDKTGWVDTAEMNATREGDLIYFEDLNELKSQGYTLVGILSEERDATLYSGNHQILCFNDIGLTIKQDTEINKTYAIMGDYCVWDNGTTFTRRGNPTTVPTPSATHNTTNYIKTEYDENGEMIPGTHGGGWSLGQTVLVVGADLTVTQDIIQKNGASEKVNYSVDRGETTVGYRINPVFKNSALDVGAIDGVTIKVEDTLPSGLSYVPGSGNYQDPTIEENPDGSTTLTWLINNCAINRTIEPITFNAHINEVVENGTQFETTVVVSEAILNGGRPKTGNTSLDQRVAKKAINIINLSSYSLYKHTETPVIEINGVVHYKVTAVNKTDSDLSEFQLLDILPYNGDGRGTSYSGTYVVQKIELSAEDLVTGASQSVAEYRLTTTNSTSVRNGVTAKDTDLGISGIWSVATSGQELNTALTGYAVKGVLTQKSKLEIDIYLKTDGNKPYDLYKNTATAQTSSLTEEMQTPIIEVQDVKRQIEGHVWFDSNKDGVKQDGEPYLKDYRVTIVKEDGTPAIDISNNNIAETRTNDDGYYSFENMVRDDYKIIVDIPDDEMEITLRGIGDDPSKNSCFYADRQSPVITEANSVAEPEIIVRNINAGIAYKDSTVLVHYYKKGTSTSLSPDVLLEGKIKDHFITEIGDEVPEYYEVDNITPYAEGEMKKNQTIIVYEYRYRKYAYKVNYYEVNENGDVIREIKNQKTGPVTTWGDTVTASNEIVTIPGFDYRNSSGNITVSHNLGENVINLYYLRNQDISYVVNYLEKDTNVVIHMQKQVSGRTYEEIVLAADEVRAVGDIYGWEYVECDKDELSLSENVEANYINLYYKKKPTQLIVHHLLDGTEERLEPDEVIDGFVSNPYQTTPSSNLLRNYRVVNTPDNQNGYLEEWITHVIYYYRSLYGNLKVRYLRLDNREPIESDYDLRGRIYSVYHTTPMDIRDYVCVSNSGNTSGIYLDDPQVVEYYYVKKSKVTVNHIDKLKYDTEVARDPDYYADGKIPEESLLCDPIIQNGKVGDEYLASAKNFTGFELTIRPNPERVTMAENPIVLNYFYNYRSAGVMEKHIDIVNGTVLDNRYQAGHEGDRYNTNEENKTFEGYVKVTNKQLLGLKHIDPENLTENGISTIKYEEMLANPDESYIPENKSGTMGRELMEVLYYYIRPTKIKVTYIDKNTGEAIPNPDGTDSEIREEGFEGEAYETDPKEFPTYEIAKNKDILTETEIIEKGLDSEASYIPENRNGNMNIDSNGNNEEEITYYYVKKSSGVTERHIDVRTGEYIVDERHQDGREGDWYVTNVENIETYRLVTNQEYYDFMEERLPDGIDPNKSYEPANAKGQMTVEEQVVEYYYVRPASVRVEYRDVTTGEEILGTLEEMWRENDFTNPNERKEDTSREYIYGREGDPYEAKEKFFENFNIIRERYPENKRGEMTVTRRPDGTYSTEIVVTFWYVENSGGVTVKYVDKETGEVLDSGEFIGSVGDDYEAEDERIEGYEMIKNKDYYSVTKMREKGLNPEDLYIPENYKGKMKKEHVEVIYYYGKRTTVTAMYIDEKAGDKIVADEVINGKSGDMYETERKKIDGYELVEVPYNADGRMSRNPTEVRYYYRKVEKPDPNPDPDPKPDSDPMPDPNPKPDPDPEPRTDPGLVPQSIRTIINNYYYTTNNYYGEGTTTISQGETAQTSQATTTLIGITSSDSNTNTNTNINTNTKNVVTITDAKNETTNNTNNNNSANNANSVIAGTPAAGDNNWIAGVMILAVLFINGMLNKLKVIKEIDEDK